MSVRNFIMGCLLLAGTAAFAVKPKPLVFRGDTLSVNDDFNRTMSGELKVAKPMQEISGIACSRTTPGYIWMESDNVSYQIIAANEHGDVCFLTLRLNLTARRWDWEDLCGGVYEGKNYLFIGAIGDNNENGGEYYIHYFEEPEIPDTVGGKKTLSNKEAMSINFQYPDGVKHNAEALMYDNREQMLYVITKKYYQPCQVFSLPFRLDYGTELQTLTYVCDLGVKSDLGEGTNPDHGFHLVTAADISPDGKYILIKNHNNTTVDRHEYGYSWTLIWEREDGESVGETLANRQPQVMGCYEEEWQGEAMCWYSSNVLYSTSDDDGNPPIYKYIRKGTEGIESPAVSEEKRGELVLMDNALYIRCKEGLFALDGRRVK